MIRGRLNHSMAKCSSDVAEAATISQWRDVKVRRRFVWFWWRYIHRFPFWITCNRPFGLGLVMIHVVGKEGSWTTQYSLSSTPGYIGKLDYHTQMYLPREHQVQTNSFSNMYCQDIIYNLSYLYWTGPSYMSHVYGCLFRYRKSTIDMFNGQSHGQYAFQQDALFALEH